ncbi:hypothetical protein TPY_3157 [Sulfobacillus acidophilus TPY]|uniref:Uncharacterized protein n=1 Tax=Sulfobacillus acidophilus (strain ATCC 700253 / DSM 10332 / NAL) TaxID=679936 RepID=G8U147_SULAD|nr:hypothetical protein TPY_3157 [Sulfobacillus acidophilus TPY]AEW04280.1 hypothetical protein Sulac_0776 [Sulfobacillus acidophilus DSM 10332]
MTGTDALAKFHEAWDNLDLQSLTCGVKLLGPVTWGDVTQVTQDWPWLSAHDAWIQWQQGRPVGHLVYQILATPRGTE